MPVPVSLVAPQFGSDPSRLIDVAVKAERLGFAGLFVVDHFFPPGGSGRPVLEMTTALGALATVTDHVRVGTMVARAPARPAWTTAHVAWTVQAMSGGRMVLGLGAADQEARAEFEAYGLAFPGWTERLARVREVIEAVGRPELRLPGIERPPVWVGGRSKELRRLAAEAADGWNQWGGSAERLRRAVRELGEASQRLTVTWGGRVAFPEVSVRVEGDDLLRGDPKAVADTLGGYLAAGAQELVVMVLGATRPGVLERFAEATSRL